MKEEMESLRQKVMSLESRLQHVGNSPGLLKNNNLFSSLLFLSFFISLCLSCLLTI